MGEDSRMQTKVSMLEWYRCVYRRFMEYKPNLLLLDGHASHLGEEMQRIAEQDGAFIKIGVPNMTWALQPLDVSINKPLKVKVREQLTQYYANHAGRISKSVFMHVVV